MARPTLQAGDTWVETLANSAGFPVLDGQDEYGHGDKVIDDWLDDAPDQIKARFYNWYDRVKVTVDSGLTVSYTGSTVLLFDGSRVTLTAGSLTLPANSLRFIYISETGSVTHAASLPTVGVALALAATDGSSVTQLEDIRQQVVESVSFLGQPDARGFVIGDIKEAAYLTPDPGWVLLDNDVLYNAVDYPIAFSRIGQVFSRAGDPVDTFRVPEGHRMFIGPGNGRSLGDTGGEESVSLTVATSARHTHPVEESPHTHAAPDSGHSHPTNDGGHSHPLYGSDTQADTRVDSIIANPAAVAGELSGNKGYVDKNANGVPLVANRSSGVSVASAKANIQIQPVSTGVKTQAVGGGQPHNNMPPYVVLNRFIRLA